MANYDSARNDIDKPGTGYFIPPVDFVSMTMDTMLANQKALVDQIKLWSDRYAVGNSSEKNNITYILQVQNGKLANYTDVINTINQQKQQAQQQSTDTANQNVVSGTVQNATTPPPAPTQKSNTLKYILIGLGVLAVVVGTIVVIKKTKHGQK